MTIQVGTTEREQWNIRNATSNIIGIGDLPKIPAFQSGQIYDLLKYYDKETLGRSITLRNLMDVGFLVLVEKIDGVNNSSTTSNNVLTASKTEINEIENDVNDIENRTEELELDTEPYTTGINKNLISLPIRVPDGTAVISMMCDDPLRASHSVFYRECRRRGIPITLNTPSVMSTYVPIGLEDTKNYYRMSNAEFSEILTRGGGCLIYHSTSHREPIGVDPGNPWPNFEDLADWYESEITGVDYREAISAISNREDAPVRSGKTLGDIVNEWLQTSQTAWGAGEKATGTIVSHEGRNWIATTTTSAEPSWDETDWDFYPIATEMDDAQFITAQGHMPPGNWMDAGAQGWMPTNSAVYKAGYERWGDQQALYPGQYEVDMPRKSIYQGYRGLPSSLNSVGENRAFVDTIIADGKFMICFSHDWLDDGETLATDGGGSAKAGSTAISDSGLAKIDFETGLSEARQLSRQNCRTTNSSADAVFYVDQEWPLSCIGKSITMAVGGDSLTTIILSRSADGETVTLNDVWPHATANQTPFDIAGVAYPAWSSATYNKNDTVAHDGSYWVVTTTDTTDEPAGATDWYELTTIVAADIGNDEKPYVLTNRFYSSSQQSQEHFGYWKSCEAQYANESYILSCYVRVSGDFKDSFPKIFIYGASEEWPGYSSTAEGEISYPQVRPFDVPTPTRYPRAMFDNLLYEYTFDGDDCIYINYNYLITSAETSDAGAKTKIITNAVHGWSNGDMITITDTVDADYNGDYTIEQVDSASFVIDEAFVKDNTGEAKDKAVDWKKINVPFTLPKPIQRFIVVLSGTRVAYSPIHWSGPITVTPNGPGLVGIDKKEIR